MVVLRRGCREEREDSFFLASISGRISALSPRLSEPKESPADGGLWPRFVVHSPPAALVSLYGGVAALDLLRRVLHASAKLEYHVLTRMNVAVPLPCTFHHAAGS